MSDIVFHAHSGVRYLVLAAALIALGVLARGRFGGRPFGKGARISGVAFTGLLDLQVLLGLTTVLLRPFQPPFIGHIVLMVAALAAAHVLAVSARRAGTDAARYRRALLGVAIPLSLILGGILAIGRPIV